MSQSVSVFRMMDLPHATRWAQGLGQPNPGHTIADLRNHMASLLTEARALQDRPIQEGSDDPNLEKLIVRIQAVYDQISELGFMFPMEPLDPLFLPSKGSYGPWLNVPNLLSVFETIQRNKALLSTWPTFLSHLPVMYNDSKLANVAMRTWNAEQIAHWLNDPSNQSHILVVRSLNFDRLGIETLPKEIGLFKNLAHIFLGRNNLSKLPEQIFTLPALETLEAPHNQLTSLNSQVLNLRSLKRIKLDHNHIHRLPAGLNELPNLTKLSLNSNLIRRLPEGIPPFASIGGNPCVGFVVEYHPGDGGCLTIMGTGGPLSANGEWKTMAHLYSDGLNRWSLHMTAGELPPPETRYEFKIVRIHEDERIEREIGPTRVSNGPPMEPIIPRFEGI